ncbi:MAG: hypothetical protein PHS53_04125 [Candidatus Pacebacteria bacterium]|nr:hypothetical protein [Candidatus Paceibacterota bacterium]
MTKKDFLQAIKISALALFLILGATALNASPWTGPTGGTPTANNVSTYVSVGSLAQARLGDFILGQSSVPGTHANFDVTGSGSFTNGVVVASQSATNGIYVQNGNAVVLNGSLGVKTATPTDPLQVKGNARATKFCIGDTATADAGCISTWPAGATYGGTPGVGKVLTDTTGNGTPAWQAKLKCVTFNFQRPKAPALGGKANNWFHKKCSDAAAADGLPSGTINTYTRLTGIAIRCDDGGLGTYNIEPGAGAMGSDISPISVTGPSDSTVLAGDEGAMSCNSDENTNNVSVMYLRCCEP